MSTRQKVLLFIHGIRNDDPTGTWRAALDAALLREGTEPLEARGYTVVAPSYLRFLDPSARPKAERPDSTYIKGSEEDYNRAAARYWSDLAELERVGIRGRVADAGHLGDIPADVIAGPMLGRLVKDAAEYCRDSDRRHRILRTILDEIPNDADLVIVAHSLGSVVAADLIYHLPRHARLRMLITLGSPLGLEPMRRHLNRRRERFPYEIAGPWINVTGTGDFITGFRGISPVFPEPLDVFISTGTDPRRTHASASYLDDDSTIARALEWLDRRHETNGANASADLPDLLADQSVLSVVAGAQYALRLEQSLEPGKRRSRVGGARALLAATFATRAAEWGDGHPILQRLAYDNGAFLRGRFEGDVAISILLSAWTSNPLTPYEIRLDDDRRQAALTNLAQDLGLPERWPDVIRAVEKDARGAHGSGWSWGRAALAAAGVAAIIAAPALVVAAAPAGLAGGAAIVSGLAALGPGGMLGGIGIVSLVGGAGGAAAANALASGSAEEVEENVIRLQAMALARRELQIHTTGAPEWSALIAMEDVVTDDHARLAQFSDGNSVLLKQHEAKLKSIRRALEWFEQRSLAPGRLEYGESEAA